MTRVGWLAVVLLLSHLPSQSLPQTEQEVQALREHFTGTWVGINHNYMVSPVATAKITITVAQDRRPDRLDMDYAYLDAGKTKEKHFKRLLVIERATSSIFIDRKGEGKMDFRVDHLDELLQKGYGDFTLHGTARYKGDERAVVRSEYHLRPTEWSYEIYVSARGGPFEKTGDWD